MNIAVVGSSGYIARHLSRFLLKKEHTLFRIGKSNKNTHYLDLEHVQEFDFSLLDVIDFIVFTAAISGPDKCADDFEICWKINVDGTIRFMKEAVNRGCRVLFFSSDAVYGDIPGHIYTEKSEMKGETPYGRMKRAVEEEFQENSLFKAIRLSYVMSANDRFISYCLNCIKNKEIAEIFHPFYRNCISISDVVDVVYWFTINFDEFKPQVLNVAGKELVSRVRMADELNRIYGNKLQYIVSQPSEDFFRNRPKITQMESLYLKEYSILVETTFTEKIRKEMEGIDV